MTFLCLVLVSANLGERVTGFRVGAYALISGPAISVLLLAVLNLVSLVTVGPGPSDAHFDPQRLLASYALMAAAGLTACASLLPVARREAGRVLKGFNPDSGVHAVSLALYWLIFFLLLANQAQTDTLKAPAAEHSSLLVSVLTGQAPMILVAFVGVGLLVRRGPDDARRRLGLVWPGWRWLAASVGIGLLLIAFGTAWDNLMSFLTPADSKAIDEITTKLILDQLSGLGGALALALAAGVCEELLFRGALMPPFGIVLSALIFAALHAQYALTLATVEIFVLGMVLGWLRIRAGTTGAIVAHTVYDGVLLVWAVLVLGH